MAVWCNLHPADFIARTYLLRDEDVYLSGLRYGVPRKMVRARYVDAHGRSARCQVSALRAERVLQI